MLNHSCNSNNNLPNHNKIPRIKLGIPFKVAFQYTNGKCDCEVD